MKRVALFALAAGLLLVAGPLPAQAKGPSAEQLPTLEDLLARAKKAKADAEQAAIDAARDPRREAIDAYKNGDTPLAEYEPLTDMIKNSKDDEVRDYRRAAATALYQRFRNEPLEDPNVRKLRVEAVLEIIDLMRAPSKDRLGLAIIHEILSAFWKNKVRDFGFSPTGKPRERYNAYKAMKKYLQNGESG